MTQDEIKYYTFTGSFKQNHAVIFSKGDKQIGCLDFNGETMKFEGDVDESAKVFFDFIAKSFASRLKKEREAEREACAKVCDGIDQRDDIHQDHVALECAAAIRVRGEE